MVPIETTRTPAGYVVTYDDAKHKYWIDGESMPSVTQILNVLDKPALKWWGMTIGVEGVARLANQDVDLPWDDPAQIVSMLTRNRLTVNHVAKNAATRGSAIHDALEKLCIGEVVKYADFPADQHGYVRALMRWWSDHEPHPEKWEVPIGSKQHRYCGKFDLIYRRDGQRILLDAKTSKAVYESHHTQLAGYAEAISEAGFGEIDHCEILRVGVDGDYEVVRSCGQPADFIALVNTYYALDGLKSRIKARRRAARAA